MVTDELRVWALEQVNGDEPREAAVRAARFWLSAIFREIAEGSEDIQDLNSSWLGQRVKTVKQRFEL